MKKITIHEYKSIVVSILAEIDRICRDNDLKYMLMYGSLIGAVRHKGFIPWDDDIDIVMPRNDYFKLMHIINSANNNYSFISIETGETIYPFGKVCDNTTIVKEKNFKTINGYGAFVDVFPLDYMPNNVLKRKIYCFICRQYAIWITHSARTSFERSNSWKINLKRYIAFKIGRQLKTTRLINRLNSILINNDRKNKGSSYIGVPWGYNAEKLYPTELFSDVTYLDFEGHKFLAPKEYDTVLKLRYGDYMKLPPKEEQVEKHSLECFLKD